MRRLTRGVTVMITLCGIIAAVPLVAHAAPDGQPLGDGRTTTDGPRAGWVYACRIMTGGGGADGPTPWISGATWFPSQKSQVQGANSWANADVSIRASGDRRVIATNGVPVGSTTGNFPISASDPAYQYDRNPNTVQATRVTVSVPRSPTPAAKPSCLPMGAIGYATNGVAIFNALDGENRDAVAHEIQDSCDGHPERSGQYHYHSGSRCVTAPATSRSTLIGYALDGFGIYVERDARGALLTNRNLDACHGRTSVVTFNGRSQRMYHYVVTAEYPYTLGCFRGPPVSLAESPPGGPVGGSVGGPAR